MKKLLLAVFVGIFCLSTTNVLAQTKQETPQEKIMRLEIENQVRQELMDSLVRRILYLEAQLNKQQAAAQNIVPALKPYYANMEIQQVCEAYPVCANRVQKRYNKFKGYRDRIIHRDFKLESMREERYFQEPSKLFGGSGWTYHKIYFKTSWGREACLTKKGKGKNPLSWSVSIDDPYKFIFPL